MLITGKKVLTVVAFLAIISSVILLVGKSFGFWEFSNLVPLLGSFGGAWLIFQSKSKNKQKES